LKPAGSLILSSGSLSTAVAIGGVGCGLRLVSCLLAAGFDLSIGLKPGGPDGAGAGGCEVRHRSCSNQKCQASGDEQTTPIRR
jgi:hypothetical protein